jgi:hypothetical protein
MAKLSDTLKRMLDGLAHQYDADYLTIHEKMEVLGVDGVGARIKQPSMHQPVAVKPATLKSTTRRIAFVSDGRGMGAPINYAIDACLRQNARIDLLVHGAVDTESLSILEKHIQQAGVDYQRIRLGMSTVDEIYDYISHHSSLIFLVAMPDDAAVKVLMEELIPRRGGRIPIPLVLIDNQSDRVESQSVRLSRKSAA